MPKTTLLRNIKTLAGIQPSDVFRLRGADMQALHKIDQAFLFIEDGRISAFGEDAQCTIDRADEIIDCRGRIVLPAFCDSHTHLVFAAWREREFVDRIKGLTYEQIAEAGGGILNSAARLQVMTEDELFDQTYARLEEVISLGTGAIEIKSGYGLTVDGELKMLRVIRRLKETNRIPVRATFLGAHGIPKAYQSNRQGYIDLIINDMLPRIADEGLADYIDVFCDRGFYTVDETDHILTAGAKYGLRARLHANELDYSGGIQVGVKHNAISVDHLEYTDDDAIAALHKSNTIATLLPTTAFFLGLPYAPARKMMEHDLCVSLASDYNPGTSPSGNLAFVLSLACIKLKMLPAEAINAMTINAAAAMELEKQLGSITVGKDAHLIITKPVSSLDYLPYSFGQSWVERVLVRG